MSGHTPGPWSIQPDKGHTFSDGSVDHGGYRIDADQVEQLAYVWNFSDRLDPTTGRQDGTRPFGSHEAESNARLIAAAPDHAAIAWSVCTGVARWESFASGAGGEFCIGGMRYATKLDAFGVPAMNDSMRAAIAKATGAQP